MIIKKKFILKIHKAVFGGEDDHECYMVFEDHIPLPEIDAEKYDCTYWINVLGADLSLRWLERHGQ